MDKHKHVNSDFMYALFAIAFTLIVAVVLLESAPEYPLITKAFHVEDSNNLMIFISGEDSILQIPLIDEMDEYLFTYKGELYSFIYKSGGYSYGEHITGRDYIEFNNSIINVIDDGTEISSK